MTALNNLYRIFTEDKNREAIANITSKYFDGFSIHNGLGYWKGQPENNLLIEIITNDQNKVNQLAKNIKHYNKQESVLVEKLANNATFI